MALQANRTAEMPLHANVVLLPSARQAILTAGPWVSRPWFEQFLRVVTPLRDQRFHRCSGDHAIG